MAQYLLKNGIDILTNLRPASSKFKCLTETSVLHHIVHQCILKWYVNAALRCSTQLSVVNAAVLFIHLLTDKAGI